MSDLEVIPTIGHLSNIGIEGANDKDLSTLWKILQNLWDPTANPNGYVSLGVAENSLMHETLVDYLKSNFTLSKSSLTYGEGGAGTSRLRNAIAHFLNRRLKPVVPLTKDHLIVTNGCSSAIEQCIFSLANPGDGVLLGQPYYGTFMSDIQLRAKAKVVKVRFQDTDPSSVGAVVNYEAALKTAEALGTKVKVLMLCNPHNPLGRCYPRETIVGLMKLCQKYNVHLISDEIYAFSVFKNNEDKSPPQVKFVSALSIDTTGIIDTRLVHVLWGMSKDFGANGIRLGAIISQANVNFRAALQVSSLYSYSSSMISETIAKLLEDDEFTDKYITQNQQKLSEHYSLVVRFLQSHKIEYAPGVNAAFFVWINLGKAYKNRHPERTFDDISTFMMDKLLANKVFLANGIAFGSEFPGWFRLVFSQDEANLTEGLRRMLAVIEEP